LNEDFEGGEFVFAADLTAKNIQSLVKPRCGRLVGFSSGSENLHGVRSVQRGRRCALGLWFTLNPFYEEIEHILAKQVLHQVQQGGSITDQLLHELKKHVSIAPSTSNPKHTPMVTTEQLKLHNNYVKGSLSLHQESGEMLASGDSNKVQIEWHKNENILDLYMPHDNYGYEDYQIV
jgi:phosphoribosylanthranilate isomerase